MCPVWNLDKIPVIKDTKDKTLYFSSNILYMNIHALQQKVMYTYPINLSNYIKFSPILIQTYFTKFDHFHKA